MEVDEDTKPNLTELAVVKEERLDPGDELGMEPNFDPPKRGRTRSLSKKSPDKVDIKAKLERSRQSARECRARKKLRYQYLEEVICETEKAIFALRREMDTLKNWGKELDDGRLPENLIQYRTSCVEKKLTSPFQLQQHHHSQIAQQRHDASLASSSSAQHHHQQQQQRFQAHQQQQLQSASSSLGSGGGICVSPSSGISSLSLSVSPSGQLSPYMTMAAMGGHSPIGSASLSVSPP